MTERDVMTGAELGTKLLASVKQTKVGKGAVAYSPVAEARAHTNLTQAQFAHLLGVSVRTLQEWEQGRRKPSGAAPTLLAVALRHPEALRELALA